MGRPNVPQLHCYIGPSCHATRWVRSITSFDSEVGTKAGANSRSGFGLRRLDYKSMQYGVTGEMAGLAFSHWFGSDEAEFWYFTLFICRCYAGVAVSLSQEQMQGIMAMGTRGVKL